MSGLASAVACSNSERTTPVRGTQSFVSIMAEIWKRPSLVALEIFWRWTFGLIALLLATWRWRGVFQPALQNIALSSGSGAGSTDVGTFAGSLNEVLRTLMHDAPFVGCACLAWAIFSAWGRGMILRRLDPPARMQFGSLLVISVLRVSCFLAVLLGWITVASSLLQTMILVPQQHRQEPSPVGFAALLIGGTLLLFVLWMALSYVFQLAPIESVEQGYGPLRSFAAAAKTGQLRSKLVEINLVLGIVKIALLVLAMVFSACPLPFSSVETQTFLMWWWIGVGLWYLVASDFFHVVRTAAFLRMWQTYKSPAIAGTQTAETAS